MRNFYIWIIIFAGIIIFEFVGSALRKRKQQSDTYINDNTATEHSGYDRDVDDYDEDDHEYDYGDFSKPQSREIRSHPQRRSYSGSRPGSPSDIFPKRNSLNKSKNNKLFS